MEWCSRSTRYDNRKKYKDSEINNFDEQGNTALLYIISEHCFDEEKLEDKPSALKSIRDLLIRGADVNQKNINGLTALHYAAANFHVDMLKMLVEFDGDVTSRNLDGETILHYACKSGVKLRNASLQTETIDYLVSVGCDIEAIDYEGYRPLHYAAQFASVEVVEKLIELGAIVDCRKDQVLLTPLHLAAKSDRLDNMKILINCGTYVDVMANDGVTPLFISALYGSLEGMKYLISHSADMKRRDRVRGFTLLHCAAYGIEPNIESETPENQVDRKARKLEFLVKRNFNVNDTANCGLTPLTIAVMAENEKMIKILVEHGANVNYRCDETEFTPLHYAVVQRHLPSIEVLIAAGADVNCPAGVEQETPLHFFLNVKKQNWTLGNYADGVTAERKRMSAMFNLWPEIYRTIQTNYSDVLQLLLRHKADLPQRDAWGNSLIHNGTLQEDIDDLNTTLPSREINDPENIPIIIKSEALKKTSITRAIKFKLLNLPIAEMYESMFQRPEFSDYFAREVNCFRNEQWEHRLLYAENKRPVIRGWIDDMSELYHLNN